MKVWMLLAFTFMFITFGIFGSTLLSSLPVIRGMIFGIAAMVCIDYIGELTKIKGDE